VAAAVELAAEVVVDREVALAQALAWALAAEEAGLVLEVVGEAEVQNPANG
jgi:hypothetical protein